MHTLAILCVHGALLLSAPPPPGGTTTTFTYNSAEQLTLVRQTAPTIVTLASSTYDGDGERVTKTEGSTTVISVRDPSGNVLAEYNAGTGALIANYVYVNGHKVCRIAADASRRYFHHDPLGTPRAVTDGAGAALWRGEHRPFGEAYTANPAGGDHFTFTGHEWEDESALLYAHARYYDPSVGRFLSTDPVGGRPDNPQTWNRYSYALNNPTKYVDPDGKWVETAFDVAMAGISIRQARKEPGFWNITGAVLDVAAVIVPVVPAVGGRAIDAVQATNKLADDVARTLNRATENAGDAQKLLPAKAGPTGQISPTEVVGRTPSEINQRAGELGLQGRGPDPAGGQGAYVDPQTGTQRILVHPRADSPHGHVNNPAGQRIGPDGRVVPSESPEAHLPIKEE